MMAPRTISLSIKFDSLLVKQDSAWLEKFMLVLVGGSSLPPALLTSLRMHGIVKCLSTIIKPMVIFVKLLALIDERADLLGFLEQWRRYLILFTPEFESTHTVA